MNNSTRIDAHAAAPTGTYAAPPCMRGWPAVGRLDGCVPDPLVIILLILLIIIAIIVAPTVCGYISDWADDLYILALPLFTSAHRLCVDELDMARSGRARRGGRQGRRSTRPSRRRGDAADSTTNSTRDGTGADAVGATIYKDLKAAPRSRSEAEVIRLLEDLTGEAFPTAFPPWLVWKGRRLELDGYNERLRIALEFSGPLHTKWTPAAETYETYYGRITRDVVKRRLCARAGVLLIVVDMSLPRARWRSYLASRLYDARAAGADGAVIVPDRPADYIPAQAAVPWRNPTLEQELGLGADMAAAEVL